MRLWAVVPVKELTGAKTRLASLLPGELRQQLMLAMLDDVLAALTLARGLAGVAVVTVDPAARYVPAAKRPVEMLTDPPPRMWVLRYGNLPDPLAGIGQPTEDVLRSRYRLEQLWLVRGLTVARYLPVSAS